MKDEPPIPAALPNPHVSSLPSILVVDDEQGIVDLLREVLEGAGFRVTGVCTSEAARRQLSSTRFDVLITDILLEDASGLDLARATADQYDTDVMMITGHAEAFTYELAHAHGAADFLVKPFRPGEIVLRVKRVLREREFRKDRDGMIRRLEEMAITDSLTGLYNSRHFFTRIEIEVSTAGRYGTPLSLLMLDIDDFKGYNDTFGHLEGDDVLVRMGDVFRECLRKSDSAYRYGGEEFALILSRTRLADAMSVAQRIRERIEASEFVPRAAQRATVTASIGVAEYRLKESVTDLIRHADQALYESKRQGKNRVTVYRE